LDEIKFGGGINLPLNFSRGIHSIFLNFGGRTTYIDISEKKLSDNDIYGDIIY
jgi:hypothetical protein